MLPLMSTATIELERHVLGREVADRLRLAVFEDAGTPIAAGRRTNRPSSSVTVTVTCTASTSTLSANCSALVRSVRTIAAAVNGVDDQPHLMFGDVGTGVPLALERRLRQLADLPAVDEEGHAPPRRRRLDAGLQQRRPAQIAARLGQTRICDLRAAPGRAR